MCHEHIMHCNFHMIYRRSKPKHFCHFFPPFLHFFFFLSWRFRHSVRSQKLWTLVYSKERVYVKLNKSQRPILSWKVYWAFIYFDVSENHSTFRALIRLFIRFFLALVLMEYQKRHGEFPDSLESNQKLQQLSDTRSDVFEKMGIDNDLLDDNFAR